MRIFLFLFAVLAVFWQVQTAEAKYASIVIEAESGRVLHSVNADTRNYPASLTKMMTLFMVFEALDGGKIKLTDRIKFSTRAAGQPPSKIGVHAGGFVTVEQAIGALVTKSANDVATAVAELLAGSEANFARRMTLRANALGMKRTNFKNASGLPNRGQLSTARDMAILVQSLQKFFPHYYHYFSMRRFHFRGTTYKNHNKLLGTYAGVDGVKTGYIRASGFNLAASVERGGVRLIGVVFGGKTSKSRNAHMKTLLDKGFARAKPSYKFAKAPVPPAPPATATPKADDLKTAFKEAAPQNPAPQNPAPQKPVAEKPVAEKPTAEKKPKAVAEQVANSVTGPKKSPQKSPAPQTKTKQAKTKNVTAFTAPPLPKAYRNGGINRTVISAEPKKIALVQDFKTGNPNYDGGGWSVQVGAYRQLPQAENFLIGILPHVSKSYETVILSQVQKRGSIYKPRLVGLPEKEARTLCDSLKAKKIDCLVLSPNAG